MIRGLQKGAGERACELVHVVLMLLLKVGESEEEDMKRGFGLGSGVAGREFWKVSMRLICALGALNTSSKVAV